MELKLENCDMDVEDIIDDVGTHNCPNVTESNEKSDQDLIRLPIQPSNNVAPADDKSGDVVVILDG